MRRKRARLLLLALALVVAVAAAWGGWWIVDRDAAAGQPPEQVMAPGADEPPEADPRTADTEETSLVRLTPPEEDDCGREAVIAANLLEPQRPGTRPTPLEVGFSLQFADEVSPWALMSTFVMPGETIDLEVVLSDPGHRFEATAAGGTLEPTGEESWRWTAPEEPSPEPTCIKVRDTTAGETACLNAFVLTPYSGEEVFHGYRMGRYPRDRYRGDPAYDMPEGFLEVTPETEELWLTPHFQLGQFLCKQPGGYPKFVILRERLLLKLEMILEEVNERGVDADTFFVMSAYRTPHYNRSIGNTTTYSRHHYGDAADIFVDMDRNSWMDDIDGDGESGIGDARFLHRIVEGMYGEAYYEPFVGGLGLYGPKPHRGSFIHVDTRGFRARW